MKADKIHIQSNSFDASTDDVVSWISFLSPNREIIAQFDDTEIQDCEIFLSNEGSCLNFNNTKISYESSYWYRRGRYKLKSFYTHDNDFLAKGIAKEYIDPIVTFLESFDPKNGINKFSDNGVNKLNILQDCISIGLNIPETLITSNIERVNEFINKHNKIICKPARNPFSRFKFGDKEFSFSSPTMLISLENKDLFPKIFLSSLFQKYVEKKLNFDRFI